MIKMIEINKPEGALSEEGEKVFRFEPWQAKAAQEPFIPIPMSLLKSPAWKALNKRQQALYMLAFFQRYPAIKEFRKKDPNPDTSPAARWPNDPQIGPDCFYLNFAKAVNNGNYKKYDRAAFYNLDRKALVDKGFLDLVVDARKMHGEKSVFRMSSRWQDWNADEEESKEEENEKV